MSIAEVLEEINPAGVDEMNVLEADDGTLYVIEGEPSFVDPDDPAYRYEPTEGITEMTVEQATDESPDARELVDLSGQGRGD